MSMVAIGLAASAVIGAGTTIAGNEASRSALNKAGRAQQAAIASLEPLNTRELNRVATRYEREHFLNSINAQKELDPTFAALREQGGANVLEGLKEDSDPNSVASRSIREVDAALTASKAGDDEIVGKLLDRVKEDLDAGATLPPEFQAELVKAGLESAGTQGLSIDGRGASGVGIRTLLGSAGLALKQSREANARTNLSAADQLRTNRLEALKSLGITASDLTGAKVTRGSAGTVIGNQNMPSIGLTGSDAANIAIQNAQLRNNQKLGIAQTQSATALGNGALTASNMGALGAAATNSLGTWVGGLLNKKKE